jgi:hypothetical protein
MNVLLAITLTVGVLANAALLTLFYMADMLPWSTRRTRRKALLNLIRHIQAHQPATRGVPAEEQATQWERLRMPTARKHALIRAGITAEQAQCPDTRSLTVEEINALAALLPTT